MTDSESEAWKRGYELGVQDNLRQNGDAIKIGDAILDVLDSRYQRIEEDY